MVINSDSPYETVKSELLFKALFYSVFDTDNDKTKPILHVQNIKKYIREHINERITLDQIAKAVFLSPNYCNRIFKKRTGSTISDFIINEKIIEAKKMILQGEVLSEVARRLGYQEYSYFSRQFKKITGITPIYFRAAKSLNP